MEITGYISAILIGVVLGLIGGGGSILTVPVLVYIFGMDAVPATAYSLFIVGISALIGTYSYLRKDLVELKMSLIFAIPSIAAVYLTRRYLVPAIPPEIESGLFMVNKDVAILVLFALLMIFSAYSMIHKSIFKVRQHDNKLGYFIIMFEGLVVGVLTGLLGAGGGFLIVPALVLFAGLPMKSAIGSSLLIIALKSLIGFTGDLQVLDINWTFLLFFSFLTILGIIGGSFLAHKISGEKLKPAFGWFVLIMGFYIIVREVII